MRNWGFALLMSSGLIGCAVDRVEPLSVPLAYSPTPKEAGMTGALSCATVGPLQVTDGRGDKGLGKRIHESKPLKADVTVTTDPIAWVAQGVDSYFTRNGLKVQAGGPKLLLTLDELHTTESIWHRASYEAQLALTGELKSADGTSCWKGTVQGKGENYGYSGSIPDYQETLNAALDAASLQLLSPQTFRDALCHCGGEAPNTAGR